MALPPVRKSGRIRSSKRSSFLANDYEYDETKFEGDDMIVENVTKFEVDVSSNISDLLNSHSKETKDESVKLGRRTSFPHVMSKLKTSGGGKKEVAENENGEGEEEEDASSSYTDMMFNLVCPLCSKRLSTKEELESHIIDRHHQEVENAGNGDTQHLSCDICGKIMNDNASYKRHMKTHTGERPYQCRQCEKCFQDSCSLKRHEKIHEDERPFSCDICLKNFRDAASISRHMLTHTDRPRMFQCSICDKNFTDKCGLRRHEKTHLGVRPFVCEVCDKTFIDSCSFKRHQKIHTGIKNHHCPHCKKSFMERQSLIRHMKTACRLQNDINGESIFLLEDDLTPGNDSYISNTSLEGAIEDKHHNLKLDGESQDSSNSSFSTPFPPNSLSYIGQQTMGSYVNKSFLKAAPSLSSLIKKDPKLYEGISEIVDSIDSYEKMLDLCGDRGQEEIDAALTRDCNPIPDNLLCFECGELLVDGVNFKSEEKIYNPSMANAFKCTSCEEEEEEDDYGEPPVLMPHYNVDTERSIEEDDGLSLSQVEFESAEHLGEQSGLYNNHRINIRGDNNGSKMSPSHSMSPTIDDHIVRNKNQKTILLGEDSSLVTAQQLADPSSTSPIIEYEADDPSIPSVFPCHLCTKVFASSSFLERHLDLHKRSPYKCMVCAKSFANAPALKRHMRVHTGEKPYSCPKCSKQFKDPSNFCKHKKNCSVIPSVVSPLDSGSTTATKSGASKDIKSRRETRVTGVKIKREPSIAFSYEEGEIDEEEEKSLKEGSNYPIMSVLPCLDEDMYNDHSPETSTYLLDNGEVMENGEIKDMNIHYIPCEICEKLCSSEHHLEMHMNFHKGNPDVTCIECGKNFADPFGLKRHMRLHTGARPFPCEYCSRGYCDNWSLKKHRSKGCLQAEVQASDLEHLHPCSQCTRVFRHPEHRQEHMKMHKGVLKYKCDVCKKGFSEAFNLKKHRRLHMAICPGCGQEFQNVKLLTNHQRTECTTESLTAKEEPEAGRTFACDICGRTYSTKAYLDRHKKIHQDIKPHVCEICNKRFSEAFKLRRHAKTAHSDRKPFVCPDCGKCFSDDASLKRHLVSSSCALNKVMGESGGSESCVCQICQKIFQKSYMLVRHMTVHSQDRPFACDMCGRSYKDTSSLKRHQMVHQGVKDFICPICGKGFYYADSLKRHMSGRCGTKTKRLKTSARTKGKEYGYSNNDFLDGNNSVFYNNNNNVDSSLIFDNESWKFKLHTLPYSPSKISEHNLVISNHGVKKIARNNNKWSCVSKKHCWLCDVKASSVSVLMVHRKTHHLHVKKPFSCGKCFLRFHRKIYCKAHKLRCHNSRKFVNPNTNNSSPSLMKVNRKYATTAGSDTDTTTATTMLNNSHVISESIAVSIEDTRKRPRRSVPRAQWSWLSQI